MGIMPHRDAGQALELALSLDIPFWPQLPNLSFYEDMYVQASEHFPGIVVDEENRRLRFTTARFEEDLTQYSQMMAGPGLFTMSQRYSAVYQSFLAQDLSGYAAIRGQSIGPVSFGFKVTDEDNKPIIYNSEVKTLLFDFLQRKVNFQYQELARKNPNAFVWLDEPGLGWVFSGLSGYSDVAARQDYRNFLNGIEGVKALHLCANVNLPYLLDIGIELLSFDAYQLEIMPKGYVKSIVDFLDRGGIISWGIVPTDSMTLDAQTPERLADQLGGYWKVIADNSSLSQQQIASQALIAPARCCLKNIGAVGASGEKATPRSNGHAALTNEERVVEKAFRYLHQISRTMKDRFNP